MMDFGKALEAVKTGSAVRRKGWNGSGMRVFLTKGSYDGEPGDHPHLIEGVPSEFFEYGDNGTVTRMPHLSLVTAHGSNVSGWAASQVDMLAEDWEIVP
jgi:hypothetical protein